MTWVVEKLGKRYKNGVWGLQDVSLSPEPGVLGVVGPSGSGKTTLIRMLATVMPPTEGSIAWNGKDVRKDPHAVRRVLGYLPQHFDAYAGLSGREFLLYIAALKGQSPKTGLDRTARVLERVGLAAIADRRMGGYSSDQRRRIGLAQALLNDPQVLLVDEPRETLNAEESASLYELLGTLADHRFVVIATDSIGSVASMATRLALLQGGRLILCTTASALVESARDRVWSVTVDQGVSADLGHRYTISARERLGGQVQLRIVSDDRPHPDAVRIEAALGDAYAYHTHRGL